MRGQERRKELEDKGSQGRERRGGGEYGRIKGVQEIKRKRGVVVLG